MCIKHGSTISRTLLHTEHSMYLYKIVRHAADMHIMPSMFARVLPLLCCPDILACLAHSSLSHSQEGISWPRVYQMSNIAYWLPKGLEGRPLGQGRHLHARAIAATHSCLCLLAIPWPL